MNASITLPMRILVTGATGGLGRNAVEYLLAHGVAVRATGRSADVGQQLAASGAKFIATDLGLAKPDELLQLTTNCDAVWHCAALSSPWGSAESFKRSNIDATRHLLDAAAQTDVKRFVHISTPAIYFDFTHRYDVDESFAAATSVNDYARTKAVAEDLVRETQDRHPQMHTTILRPRAIFGPHDQVLIPRLMQVLKKKKGKLPLPRGGRTVIDMTYAGNVVHAMWLATSKADLAPGQTFNITNGEPAEIAQVLQQLFVEQLQRKMRIVDAPYALVAAAAGAMEVWSHVTGKEPALTRYSAGVLAYDMTLSIDKARTVLGYVPPIALAEGIVRTANWLKAQSPQSW